MFHRFVYKWHKAPQHCFGVFIVELAENSKVFLTLVVCQWF